MTNNGAKCGYRTEICPNEIRSMQAKHSGKYICILGDGDDPSREECYLYCKNNCSGNGETIIKIGGTFSWEFVWISIAVVIVGVAVAINLVQWHLHIKRKNRGLSNTEIVLFNSAMQHENKSSELFINPVNLPYDQNNIEIPDDIYQIDRESILGCGAFGIVYKGRIKDNLVAVKTTKSGCEKRYLTSLLQELKIMIHIGRHPNIVGLLGAKTKSLSQAGKYASSDNMKGLCYETIMKPKKLEKSTIGCLEGFLRKCRNSFVTENSTGDIGEIDRYFDPTNGANIAFNITSSQLEKWSLQIINALQHLRRKKVIHGDLATRNVLIFDVDTVKITDFGLSRKRYNYSNYIKQSQEPLPWRWMAIEALRDMTFSFQSDIWSFGITLWEIFSLAETPYPGMTYSLDFIKQLENGLRMDSPKYAPPAIYTLMQKCWRLRPEERPTIEDLAAEFSQIINKNTSPETVTYLEI